MKRYNPFKDIKIAAIIGVIILAFVFLFLGFYNTTMSNIAKFEDGTRQSFTQAIVLTGNISAFIVVVAVSVFELFRRMEIGQNKMINKIASATVMIYIVHDVEFTYSFCRIINWPRLLHQSIIKTVVLLIYYHHNSDIPVWILCVSFAAAVKKSRSTVTKISNKQRQRR